MVTQEQAIEVRTTAAPLSIEQITERYELVQAVVNKVMVKGRHYLVIPGTEKPTLVQPGAEALCLAFRLSVDPECIEKVENWEQGFFFYRYRVNLRHQITGDLLASAEGSCNSKERRYRNQDVYSIANTILKMAQKRAFVAATLKATGASNLFTQDIEDPEDLAPAKGKPASKNTAPANAKPAVDDAIVNRLKAAQEKLGWSRDDLGAWIREHYGNGFVALPQEKQKEVVDALEAMATPDELPA